jgi:hypothetical protein
MAAHVHQGVFRMLCQVITLKGNHFQHCAFLVLSANHRRNILSQQQYATLVKLKALCLKRNDSFTLTNQQQGKLRSNFHP